MEAGLPGHAAARQQFLVASHISNPGGLRQRERLQPVPTALLLSPHCDKLFAPHWISFDPGVALLCEH